MQRPTTSEKMARVTQLLQQGTPVDSHTIARELGVHVITASNWLRGLHTLGMIHIADWLPDSLGRDKRAAYLWGSAPDAERRRLTRAEISKRYRQRKQQEEQDGRSQDVL